MSSSVYFDNKNIFNLCERPTQGLDDTILTAEGIYILLILHNQITDLY